MNSYREFIRKFLLDGGYGVYARIIDLYPEQLEALGTPSAFRRWLAQELDVPLEKINLSSLNSALQQKRKKAKQTEWDQSGVKLPEQELLEDHRGFRFFKPKTDDGTESRIREM
jgi:hypothetical protein